MLENENATSEAAIPENEQSATATDEKVNTEQTDGTTQEEATDTANDGASGDNEGEAVPTFALDVQYNKENLSLSREEAKDYAEQGMYFKNKIRPMFDKLDYLAAQRDTTVEALVDGLLSSDENAYKQSLVEKFGDDENMISDLMRVYHDKNKEKYDAVLSQRNTAKEQETANANQRVAEEFSAVKAEFPEYQKFEDLPESVRTAAYNGGKNLMTELLLHRHREDKRIAAEKQNAAKNAEATAGSGGNGGATDDNAFSAFLRGFNS